MVPDLEVLVVSYGNRVQPFELLNKILLELEKYVCSIKPAMSMSYSSPLCKDTSIYQTV